MPTTLSPIEIDVRGLPPRERHRLILSTFRGLGTDAAMEIVIDHDPGALYYTMHEEQPDGLSWDYLENGPAVWRVRVARLGKAHGDTRCCGACGGL